LVVAACDTIREALEFGGKEDTIGKVCYGISLSGTVQRLDLET
jgi:hypothetical protein